MILELRSKLLKKLTNKPDEDSKSDVQVVDNYQRTSSSIGAIMTKNRKAPIRTQLAKESEAADELLSQSIVKKKEWATKYSINTAKIYELYSEFSSMVLVAKMAAANTDSRSKMDQILDVNDQQLSKLLKLAHQPDMRL